MAVTINQVTTNNSSDVSSITFSHITNAGTDRHLFVFIGGGRSDANVTAVTWGGDALVELIRGAEPDRNWVEIWHLVAQPAVKTADIVITLDLADDDIITGAVTYDGVDQTTPQSGSVGKGAADANPFVTVTSATGDLVAGVVNSAIATQAPGAGQTGRWDLDGASGRGHGSGSDEPGAASVTHSYTIVAGRYGVAGVSIHAAAGGAALVKVNAEILDISEATAQTKAMTRVNAEILDIVENSISVLGLIKTNAEILELVEAFALLRGRISVNPEILDIIEAEVVIKGFAQLGNEILDIVEANVTHRGRISVNAEILDIVEANVTHLGLVRLASEILDLVEDFALVRGRIKVNPEILDIVEQSIAHRGRVLVNPESLDLVEQSLSILGIVKANPEVLEVVESFVEKTVINIISAEILDIVEANVTHRGRINVNAEVLELVEANVAHRGRVEIGTEALDLVEVNVTHLGLVKVLSEILDLGPTSRDYLDDFETDEFVDSDVKISVNTGQSRLNFNIQADFTNDASASDLANASRLGNNLSDTEFVVRFKLRFTDITGGLNNNHFFAGVSNLGNGTNAGNGTEDAIYLRMSGGVSGYNFFISWKNSSALNTVGFAEIPRENFDYFVEIKRTSLTSVTIGLYSDPFFKQLIEEKTATLSSVTALQFFKVSNWKFANSNDRFIFGTLDDLEIYDAISTVTPEAIFVRGISKTNAEVLDLVETEIVHRGRVSVNPEILRLQDTRDIEFASLQARIKFDGDVLDSSGNGNDGTITGTETYAYGKLGRAGDFDAGVSKIDYVTLGNEGNFDYTPTTPFSVVFWMKAVGNVAFNSPISKDQNGTNNGWYCAINGGSRLEWVIRSGGQFHVVATDININDDVWRRMVLTFNGNANRDGMKIYIDGKLHKEGLPRVMIGSFVNNDSVRIGAYSGGTLSQFLGLMDDVQIYDVELNPEQIGNMIENVIPHRARVSVNTESLDIVEDNVSALGIVKLNAEILDLVEANVTNIVRIIVTDEVLDLVESEIAHRGRVEIGTETLDLPENNVTRIGLVRVIGEALDIVEDNITKAVRVIVTSEVLDLIESEVVHRGRVEIGNEILDLPESSVTHIGLVRVLAEILDLVEDSVTVVTTTGLVKVNPEALDLVEDNITKLVEVIVTSEVLDLVETEIVHRGRVQIGNAEALDLVEASNLVRGRIKTNAEILEFIESNVTHRGRVSVNAEILDIVDDSATVLGIVKANAEALDLVEDNVIKIIRIIVAAEVLEVVESEIAHRGRVEIGTETLDLPENNVTHVGLIKVLAEILDIPEQSVTHRGRVSVNPEGLDIPEGNVFIRGLVKLKSEILDLVDSAISKVTAAGIVVVANEILEFAETFVQKLTFVAAPPAPKGGGGGMVTLTLTERVPLLPKEDKGDVEKFKISVEKLDLSDFFILISINKIREIGKLKLSILKDVVSPILPIKIIKPIVKLGAEFAALVNVFTKIAHIVTRYNKIDISSIKINTSVNKMIKTSPNKMILLTAELSSTYDELHNELKDVMITISKDGKLYKESVPKKIGDKYVSKVFFSKHAEMGEYKAEWVFNFGDESITQEDSIFLYKPVEVSSDIILPSDEDDYHEVPEDIKQRLVKENED